MSTKIILPKAADYLVSPTPFYQDTHRLLELFGKVNFKLNLILQGDTGLGKSLAVAHFAAKNNIPLVTHWCSEDERKDSLVGHLELVGGETVYLLGPLPRAVEVANQAGSAILLLEEINAWRPETQKVLNSLTDWHREIETDHGFWKLQTGQLWIVATMNTSAYGGVYAINEDLKARFRILPLGYAPPAVEKALVLSSVPGVSPALVDQVLTIAQHTRTKSIDYALSPRDVIAIVEDSKTVGIREALRLQSGKFEGSDRETFVEWCKSVLSADTAPAGSGKSVKSKSA